MLDTNTRHIYMIYTPAERPLIEPIVETLTTQYDVEMRMAPPGIKAGSDGWRKMVEADMRQCDSAMIVLSTRAVQDETVNWRFALALKLDLQMIVPVAFIEEISSLGAITIEPLQEVKFYNWLRYDPANHEPSVTYIAEALRLSKKQPIVTCFISYSRQDGEFATRLAEDLRKLDIETWRDAENIPAGANWDREIEKALNNCTHVVFIVSRNSVASENVLDEIGLALNKSKTVIPVLLEECELPLRVHRAQWIDFRNDYDTALQHLQEQLSPRIN